MSRKTRKLIWSVPLVAVLAVVGALAIFAALAPQRGSRARGRQCMGPPAAVTMLAAEAAADDSDHAGAGRAQRRQHHVEGVGHHRRQRQ